MASRAHFFWLCAAPDRGERAFLPPEASPSGNPPRLVPTVMSTAPLDELRTTDRLLQRACDDDDDAWTLLVHRVSDAMLPLIHRRWSARVGRVVSPEDVLQIVWGRVYDARGTLPQIRRGTFRFWLAAVLRNELSSLLRKHLRREGHHDEVDDTIVAEVAEICDESFRAVDDRIDAIITLAAVPCDDDREFLAAWAEGASLEDLATRYGTSRRSVGRRLCRITEELVRTSR